MRYHPWREASRIKNLEIVFVDLPPGVRGRTIGDRIEISRALDKSDDRRSTLSHELGHHERGCLVPVDPVLRAREEATVERIAARRLVTLDHLLDVLCWSQHIGEIADELWIDIPMLKARVADLTPAERRWIEDELERRAA